MSQSTPQLRIGRLITRFFHYRVPRFQIRNYPGTRVRFRFQKCMGICLNLNLYLLCNIVIISSVLVRFWRSNYQIPLSWGRGIHFWCQKVRSYCTRVRFRFQPKKSEKTLQGGKTSLIAEKYPGTRTYYPVPVPRNRMAHYPGNPVPHSSLVETHRHRYRDTWYPENYIDKDKITKQKLF